MIDIEIPTDSGLNNVSVNNSVYCSQMYQFFVDAVYASLVVISRS